jgi:hypothetical protein
MSFSFLRNSRIFPLFLFLLLVPVTAMGQKLHPKLKESKPGEAHSTLQRLVVLPAQVSLVKGGMKGNEPLEKEAAAATPIIEQAVAKALTAKNLSVMDSPFKSETLQSDEKLKYALADLQRNYAELLPKILKKKKDVEKARFSLGDQVLLLNQDDNIDAFVFVHAFGQRKSGGMKALGAITLSPLLMMPTYFVRVAIADARSGEVLAYTEAFTILDIAKADDKHLVELLTKSLKKIPTGTAAEKTTAEKK